MMKTKYLTKLILITLFFISIVSCEKSGIETKTDEETKENSKEDKTENTIAKKTKELTWSIQVNTVKDNKYTLQIEEDVEVETPTIYYWFIKHQPSENNIYGITEPKQLSSLSYRSKGTVENYFLYFEEEGVSGQLIPFKTTVKGKLISLPFVLSEGISEFVVVAITKEYPNGILKTKAFQKNENELQEIKKEAVKKENTSVLEKKDNENMESKSTIETKEESSSHPKSIDFIIETGKDFKSLGYHINLRAIAVKGATSYIWEVTSKNKVLRYEKNELLNGVLQTSNRNLYWDARKIVLGEPIEFCLVVKTKEHKEGVKVCKTFLRTQEDVNQIKAFAERNI